MMLVGLCVSMGGCASKCSVKGLAVYVATSLRYVCAWTSHGDIVRLRAHAISQDSNRSVELAANLSHTSEPRRFNVQSNQSLVNLHLSI